VDYDIIVAGGKKVWTDGDPTKQPHLMAVLATNIRNTKHPKLVERKETRDHSRRAHREQRALCGAAASTQTLLGPVRKTKKPGPARHPQRRGPWPGSFFGIER
jgi:hypothetical protein